MHLLLFAAIACLGAVPARATDENPARPLDEIVVIGTTPVPGRSVNVDKVAGNVQSLSARDLSQDGTASILSGLTHWSSVNINDALADAFQPDILYRGFEASPVLGTPQGLAVYQNGVRINEAFGDTVNWDLFPDIAVDRIDMVSANPLFGLNALGGAMSVTMKNGFSHLGADGDLSGGSFKQRQGDAEYGANNGRLGIYAAARVLDQTGWRLFSRDSVRQYYLDMSLREAGAAAFDLNYTHADNRLFGQGAAPVQSLAISPENVFTGPQSNFNTLNFVTLNASLKLTDTLAMQGVLYTRDFDQTVANGDASGFTACTKSASGALCQSDGLTPLIGAAGALIPDISNRGAKLLGQNDFDRIRSEGWGASLQLAYSAALLGHGNDLAIGATFDSARTNFFSGTEVGLLDHSRTVVPSGLFIDTPEGEDFSATPVDLDANNLYYGFYLTDTLDLGPLLSVTASGRYNIAKVGLTDQLGNALTGDNRFTHFNPAIGATYKVAPSVTAYAGYSTNNRAPTASEIECSDPLKPCLLPSSLAGDPPNLRQVIAHTFEFGLRGRASNAQGHFTWNAGLFRTNSEDDIYGIATSMSTGFFQNIGATRRQGIEAAVNYQGEHWTGYAQYSYVEAIFRSPLLLNSPSNPFADAHGNIRVLPGERLPLIPLNRLKIGADFAVSHDWSWGASLLLAGSSFYRGDESNQNPLLPGYHVINLRTSYRVNRQVELFAHVQNLFDERYSTFGLFSDPTGVGAPGVPPNAHASELGVDNRFQSPAMPRAYFGGVKFAF